MVTDVQVIKERVGHGCGVFRERPLRGTSMERDTGHARRKENLLDMKARGNAGPSVSVLTDATTYYVETQFHVGSSVVQSCKAKSKGISNIA